MTIESGSTSGCTRVDEKPGVSMSMLRLIMMTSAEGSGSAKPSPGWKRTRSDTPTAAVYSSKIGAPAGRSKPTPVRCGFARPTYDGSFRSRNRSVSGVFAYTPSVRARKSSATSASRKSAADRGCRPRRPTRTHDRSAGSCQDSTGDARLGRAMGDTSRRHHGPGSRWGDRRSAATWGPTFRLRHGFGGPP